MTDEDVAVSVTKRRLCPFINSAWRSLSSLFIFYGMVTTRGPVIIDSISEYILSML